MKFNTTNEIQAFDFKDCIVNKLEISAGTVTLTLEALIVKSNNSQNSNYTDSYAGDTVAEFKDASVKRLVKIGHKKYDANDVCIEEVPDEEMPYNSIDLKKLLETAYLPEINKISESEYALIFEIAEEAYSIPEEYELTISCSQIDIGWNEYMNRVQTM